MTDTEYTSSNLFHMMRINSHSTYSHIAHSSFSLRCFLRRVSLFIDTRPTELHLKRSASVPLSFPLRLCYAQSSHIHVRATVMYTRSAVVVDTIAICRYNFVCRWWADLLSHARLLIFFFHSISIRISNCILYTQLRGSRGGDCGGNRRKRNTAHEWC